MAIDDLLGRLEKVKAVGPNRWIACCPAHNDKSPSLSVREVEDGRILLKCWAGCSALDVVESVGLRLSDLMPPLDEHQYKAMKKSFSDKQMLLCLGDESVIVWVTARMLENGEKLSRDGMNRLSLAVKKIHNIIGACK